MSHFTATKWAIRQEAKFLWGATTLGDNDYRTPQMHVLSEDTLLFGSKEEAEEKLKEFRFPGNEVFEIVEVRFALQDHWWPDVKHIQRRALPFYPWCKDVKQQDIFVRGHHAIFRARYLLVFGAEPETRISLDVGNIRVVENVPARLHELQHDLTRELDEWLDVELPDRCQICAPTAEIGQHFHLRLEGGLIESAVLIGVEYNRNWEGN